jgi:release factor glutamine methyltransferase
MVDAFRKQGLDTAILDARLLLCHALAISETTYYCHPELGVDELQLQRIEQLMRRRMAGEPVSRIVNLRAFWKHEFALGAETLDPRPDSELLIEVSLQLVRQVGKTKDPLHILDLGTGSGALLISLLLELPNARGLGVDVSFQALDIARQNAHYLGLLERIEFIQGDWLDGVSGQFDLLICNPPYIPREQIKDLSREVRLFDPRRALDGGEDGLDPYRIIIPQLERILKPSGFAVFEIGQGQHMAVLQLLENAGFYGAGGSDGTYRDLAGTIRCLASSLQKNTKGEKRQDYTQEKE